MRSKLIIGFLVFLALLISQAPAGIARWLVAQSGQASLLNATGTLWSGQGDLLIAQQSMGRISWDLQGVTILQGKLGYHVALTGPDQDLTGSVQSGFSGINLQVSGLVRNVAVNRWLETYNILLSGDFTLQEVAVNIRDGFPERTSGSVHWAGGAVTYQLAGKISSGILPEMTALLGPGPEATVLPVGGQTPLLQAEIQHNGFAKVGVTKALTKMLDTPWPGADPDHAVVLEVEEQVF